MNITPSQCRAGRALLGLTQNQLAQASQVSVRTINHFEKAEREPIPATLFAIRRALEDAGVMFVADDTAGPGVRLRERA